MRCSGNARVSFCICDGTIYLEVAMAAYWCYARGRFALICSAASVFRTGLLFGCYRLPLARGPVFFHTRKRAITTSITQQRGRADVIPTVAVVDASDAHGFTGTVRDHVCMAHLIGSRIQFWLTLFAQRCVCACAPNFAYA